MASTKSKNTAAARKASAPKATNGQGQNCAVINPYALAELIAGRKISWKDLPDAPSMLEQILGTPYNQLFDPKYGGPLYTGLSLDKNLKLVPVRSPLLDLVEPTEGNDTQTNSLIDLGQYTTLRQAMENKQLTSIIDWPITCFNLANLSQFSVSLKLPEALHTLQLGQVLSPSIVKSVIFDPNIRVSIDSGWTPPNGQWARAGTFFHETAEFFDPIQGAVANCYYIASLSAIAWATPFRIAHLTRATGLNQEQFNDLIHFYKADSGGAIDKDIQITENLPLTASGDFIYCRSSESGETWPAVYEKAFAKLKTGTSTDMPDITQTAWGDCVYATSQLNGGARHYYNTVDHSADDLWQILRSNCLSCRTFNPMTAWTYSSGDAAPDHVDYSSANVVGSHCYTVLGWAYANCRRWIVLRNPWGNTEATASVLDTTITMYDVSWWRPITLKTVDGVFAMEISAFKKYYAGFGTAF
ncbi:MAG TPA: C2 family cysteine protease [Edaphobacter sp.]|nr:C2 family cysteine protease [Edaphobacter sp.]